MWSAQADVLRMAATEEKRERIKWYYARRTFFGFGDFAQGLELAKHCNHEDARLLVSIFPSGAPVLAEEAAIAFSAHTDPRCQCWWSVCSSEPVAQPLLRSAEAGYAWAQYLVARNTGEVSSASAWLQKAVDQGEPDADVTYCSNIMETGRYAAEDEERAERALREAALLGEPNAQCELADMCFPHGSLGQCIWLRRSATGGINYALRQLVRLAGYLVESYERGASGRIVFELGSALAVWEDDHEAKSIAACQRALQLYRQWCEDARRAVFCWLWLARNMSVAKDIRIVIADLIWSEKVAWSDTRV